MSALPEQQGLRSRRLHVLWIATLLAGIAGAPAVHDSAATAKTPGSTYCYYGTCHRVKTLAEMEQLVGQQSVLATSFYDSCKRDKLNPCGLTSSGEVFDPHRADNAASPIYPDGTMLIVRNPKTQDTAVVRVNNAGPYWGKRKLDVSRATAEKLGFKKSGVAKLEVRVVKAPKPAEAKYRRNRKYEPVPGYIGRFQDADTAHAGMTAVMALETAATALLGQVTSGLALALGDSQPAAPAEPLITLASATNRDASTATKPKRAQSVRVASRGKASRTRVASGRKTASRTRLAAKASRIAKSRVASIKSKSKSRLMVTAVNKPGKKVAGQGRAAKRVAAAEQRRRAESEGNYQRL